MIKHLALVLNTDDPRAVAAEVQVRARATAGGYELVDLREITQPVDLVLALGGDGTILRAVHLLGEREAPILGVKFGRLGFLSGAPADDLLPALDAALSGQATLEDRALLAVNAWSGEQNLGSYTALNEALLGRGAAGGVITTQLDINGHAIYTQTGDGLIAATATGSTAYALSAGGPILSPSYDGMALVALASHTLVNRAIVTAPQDSVRISLPEPNRAAATLIIDGTPLEMASPLTHIDISMSSRHVRLVKLDSRLFFDTLACEFFGAI